MAPCLRALCGPGLPDSAVCIVGPAGVYLVADGAIVFLPARVSIEAVMHSEFAWYRKQYPIGMRAVNSLPIQKALVMLAPTNRLVTVAHEHLIYSLAILYCLS